MRHKISIKSYLPKTNCPLLVKFAVAINQSVKYFWITSTALWHCALPNWKDKRWIIGMPRRIIYRPKQTLTTITLNHYLNWLSLAFSLAMAISHSRIIAGSLSLTSAKLPATRTFIFSIAISFWFNYRERTKLIIFRVRHKTVTNSILSAFNVHLWWRVSVCELFMRNFASLAGF